MKKLAVALMICMLLVACGDPGEYYESYYDQSNLKGDIHKISTKIYGMAHLDGSITMTYNLETYIVEELTFKKNQRTKLLLKDSEDVIIVDRIFKYNKNDQLEQIVSSEVEANGTKEARMAYYKNGRMKSMTNIDAQGHEVNVVTYDNEAKEKNMAMSYEYNDKGDVVLSAVSSEGEVVKTETYNYVYDDQDNWIEREVLRDDTIVFKTVRTITYE